MTLIIAMNLPVYVSRSIDCNLLDVQAVAINNLPHAVAPKAEDISQHDWALIYDCMGWIIHTANIFLSLVVQRTWPDAPIFAAKKIRWWQEILFEDRLEN